jgi:hypothetical protein
MPKRLPKKRKKISSLRLILGAIICLFFFGIGWRTYQGFHQSVWDGNSQINLVLASQPVTLVSFSPARGSLKILLIPDKTFIETTHGYGQYRVEALEGLGELEKRPSLLAESCQEFLGLPVDGWLGGGRQEMIFSQTGEEGERQSKQTITNQLFQLIKKKEETNLTRWDLFRLWRQISQVRFDKVSLIDLGKTSALLAKTLPDGTPGFEIDQNRLDNLLARYFQDEQLGEEGLSLEILNATDHAGLASQGARIITNLGGRVVGIKDWPSRSDQCQIRSKPERMGSYTLKRLAKIFACQLTSGDLGDSRAEAVIILGEDYWRKLKEK